MRLTTTIRHHCLHYIAIAVVPCRVHFLRQRCWCLYLESSVSIGVYRVLHQLFATAPVPESEDSSYVHCHLGVCHWHTAVHLRRTRYQRRILVNVPVHVNVVYLHLIRWTFIVLHLDSHATAIASQSPDVVRTVLAFFWYHEVSCRRTVFVCHHSLLSHLLVLSVSQRQYHHLSWRCQCLLAFQHSMTDSRHVHRLTSAIYRPVSVEVQVVLHLLRLP